MVRIGGKSSLIQQSHPWVLKIETGQRSCLEELSPNTMPPANPEPVSEDFNIVLLGSFNPAIFHPEWFVRHGLFSEDALESAKIDVVTTDFAQFTIKGVRLSCNDRHLTIASSMTHVEILKDALMGMLDLLSHLPVHAVGMNNEAVFRAKSQKQWHQVGDTLAPKDPVWNKICKEPGMLSLTIHSTVEWTHPLVENLTVHPHPIGGPHHPAIAVTTNLHFTIPKASTVEAAPSVTSLVAFFINAMWHRATRRARVVANNIFETIPI